MTDANAAPGDVCDRYELGETAGSDGWADSWHARSKITGGTVLLCMLPQRWSETTPDSGRLRGLFPRLVGATHTFLLPLVDHGERDGRPCLVFAAAPGVTLADEMTRGMPLPEIQALRIVEQTAEALAWLHDRFGLVHGELATEAIGLVPSQIGGFEVRLLRWLGPRSDWRDGGRRLLSDFPDHVAPERLVTLNAGVSGDIYGIGALLFHMLTGRPPFAGRAEDVRDAQRDGPVPDPGKAVPSLCPETRALVSTAMAKEPHERFLNLQGLLTACRRAQAAIAPEQIRTSVRLLRKPMDTTIGKDQPSVPPPPKPVVEEDPWDMDKPRLVTNPNSLPGQPQTTSRTRRMPGNGPSPAIGTAVTKRIGDASASSGTNRVKKPATARVVTNRVQYAAPHAQATSPRSRVIVLVVLVVVLIALCLR
ncbi:MAG: hypothetical protein H0W72_10570 [Planctomycetes bacterium]|nr:hypothetical protein [Planctomycetota bacterium]